MGLDSYLETSDGEELGYWRKANHIHNWFMENCEKRDESSRKVTKEDLEALHELCYEVLKNKDNAEELLPTCSGFFFGSTDYDEYYFKQIEDTIEILELALTGTKFEEVEVTYIASW